MAQHWFSTDLSTLFGTLLSAVGIYVALMLFTRVAGLRSFSKMSSFDFAITVAFGSILASTILSRTPALATGAAGLAALFLIQYVVARARRYSNRIQRWVDNEPLLLMVGEHVLADNLSTAQVTTDDLNANLRQAGIARRADVLAVILETTGDVSVIERGAGFDVELFSDVRGRERLAEWAAKNPE